MEHKLFFFARIPRDQWTAALWREEAVLWVVFAITGSSAARGARMLLKDGLGVQGGVVDGPWSWRAAYFSLMFPLYTCTLLLVGTLARRQVYFRRFAFKMWSRFLPKRFL